MAYPFKPSKTIQDFVDHSQTSYDIGHWTMPDHTDGPTEEEHLERAKKEIAYLPQLTDQAFQPASYLGRVKQHLAEIPETVHKAVKHIFTYQF